MRILIILLIPALFFSCKDKPVEPDVVINGNEILIANEGNFGWGNGSLTIYDPENKQVQQNVFDNVNSEKLGNVFQSITHIGERFYFVINNSSEIVVADEQFKQIAKISGFNSPRYLIPVSDKKAFVSDLYANHVAIVDLVTNTISGTIKLNGWNEQGITIDQKTYVCNMDHEFLYVIDNVSNKITDSIQVGFSVESIIIDETQNIWVLNKGNGTDKAAHLTQINPTVDTVINQISVDGVPADLNYDKLNNRLLFISENIYQLNVNTDTKPKLFNAFTGQTLYRLGVDPKTSEVYVSDVFDYVSQSQITRFNADGEQLDQFNAGIISTDFYFKPKF